MSYLNSLEAWSYLLISVGVEEQSHHQKSPIPLIQRSIDLVTNKTKAKRMMNLYLFLEQKGQMVMFPYL